VLSGQSSTALTAPWLFPYSVITPLLTESAGSHPLSVLAYIHISLFTASEELVKPDFLSGI